MRVQEYKRGSERGLTVSHGAEKCGFSAVSFEAFGNVGKDR